MSLIIWRNMKILLLKYFNRLSTNTLQLLKIRFLFYKELLKIRGLEWMLIHSLLLLFSINFSNSINHQTNTFKKWPPFLWIISKKSLIILQFLMITIKELLWDCFLEFNWTKKWSMSRIQVDLLLWTVQPSSDFKSKLYEGISPKFSIWENWFILSTIKTLDQNKCVQKLKNSFN